MDLVTQGLLGSVVAQAGFSEKLGKKTALYGFIIGLIPDFDIVSAYWGEWASLEYHRGPTHALPILILFSLPVAILLKKIFRSDAKTRDWFLATFFCLFTHPLIDWCTAYGTPLFWPFTNTRFANDSLPIIDPLYSLPLLISTFIGIFYFLTPRKRKAIALAALMISSLYAFWGYRNSQTIISEASKLFAEKSFNSQFLRATPTLFNNQLFRVIGMNNKHEFMITYMKIGKPVPLTEILKITADSGPLVEKTLQHKYGKLFKWFAMEMVCPKVSKLPDGKTVVELMDMRYGFMTDLESSLFAAKAVFDQQNELISFTRGHPRRRQSFKKELVRMSAEFF